MPRYKKILVPYDDSESAKHAVDEAKRWIDEAFAEEIDVISVIPLSNSGYLFSDGMSQPGSSYMDADQVKQLQDDVSQRDLDRLDTAIEQRLGNDRKHVNSDIVFGATVADAIIDYIEDSGCDVVIMGCRGLGAVRGMLGSVSYAVLRKAKIPVFIVK